MELAHITGSRLMRCVLDHGPSVLMAIVLPHDGRRCLHRHESCAAVRPYRSRRNHRTNSRRGLDRRRNMDPGNHRRAAPVAGTRLTLTIHGPRFGGFDGCNSFGGQHQSGTPVVRTNGAISVPEFAITRCRLPDGRRTRPGEPVPRSHDPGGQGPSRRRSPAHRQRWREKLHWCLPGMITQ